MGKADAVWSEWRNVGLIDGKRHAACRHCGHRLQVNATRFKHHIVHCKHAPDEVKDKFRLVVSQQSMTSVNQKRKLIDDDESSSKMSSKTRQNMNMTKRITTSADVDNIDEIQSDSDDNTTQTQTHNHDAASASVPSCSSIADVKSESVTVKQKVIHGFFDSVNSVEQVRLDCLFAEACYTAGWSFHSVENPFVQDFLQAIRPGWRPPSAYQLGNKLLDNTKAKVDNIIGGHCFGGWCTCSPRQTQFQSL
jgi:hypothetical protein